MIGGELLEMNDTGWGRPAWNKSRRAWMVKICSWSAIFIRTTFFSSFMVCLISWMMFVLTGMKFVVNQPIFVDVRFDKNEICSESTNNCGFLTFSFAFISFVVSG